MMYRSKFYIPNNEYNNIIIIHITIYPFKIKMNKYYGLKYIIIRAVAKFSGALGNVTIIC